MSQVAELWNCRDEDEWRRALEQYWRTETVLANLKLEKDMDSPDLAARVQQLDMQGWYDFLLNQYFRWKYTYPNRYASTTGALKRYSDTNTRGELYQIKERLFAFDQEDIREGLTIAGLIKGLGTAGASGLLAVLFPKNFGTVDQFIVKALCEVDTLREIGAIKRMKPERLTVRDAILLIGIMRTKAQENNRIFVTDLWTPRRIDMVLWTLGHGCEPGNTC